MTMRWIPHLCGLFLAATFAFDSQAQGPERLSIDGSTGVMPLATSLAKAFQAQNPGVIVELGKGLGTKARLQALAEGRIDIALASHGLSSGDLASQQMVAHEIARMAVVLAVNATVPVAGLAEQQVCDIYAGKTLTWNVVGGPEMGIAARTRPDSEVDAEVIRAGIPCMKELRMAESVKVMPRSGDMANELASTAGSFGMTTMTVVEQSGGKIKPLTINGTSPSAQNVEQGVYRLARLSILVAKAAPTPAVARFLAFVRSPAGTQLIRENGAIPVK